MKILITGINGFVGSNMVANWKSSHQIYGLDIVKKEKEGVIETFSWTDLDDSDSIPQVDAIIHLAGKAHDVKNQALAQDYFDINTGLTQKIYDYFLASKATKFVFFSTVKAVADSVEGWLSEDVAPAPIGPYGESKIKAEEYINQQQLLQESNILKQNKYTYILRPCMIHGPGNKGNLNLLYKVVYRGIPWPLGAFDNKRTFSSIDNVTFVVNSLLTQNVPSGVYNMADDDPISTNQLIEIISRESGKKCIIWRLPKSLIKILAKIGGVVHLPLNPVRLRKLTENYCVSNKKIKAAIGVEVLPVAAIEGIARTINSFKNKKCY